MIGIILASHGKFAEGIKQSAEMIFGAQENLQAVTFMPEEGPEDLRAHLLEAVESFDDALQILFLVDLWGGSPFNQANIIHEEMPERTAIVSGLNLPMLLEALGQRFGSDEVEAVAKHILSREVSGIRVKPEAFGEGIDEAPAAAEATESNVGTLAPGTVLGDGKIKYVLARVDTRLLHGQVATGWVRSVNPNRIIVVSDKVAHDDMRKSLIQQAAPNGVRANTIPVSKLAEIDKDPRFGNTKALLLFETPDDVLAAVEAGVDIKEVNLGSMAHSKGKTMISRSLSVDEHDVETLRKLQDLGVKFDVRKVPADSDENLEKLLKNNNLI
ncbi:mannose/fructose/sorbose PTS transporter subunit IIA [Aerococcus sp. 1KP-2016]|jgi:PTS system mannose-specific IIB component|uniref:mannose/fructose/sorbose PTS transporter subunit IIA n=1 Tax=Aerococcus sp. 1KP-2016 TaxID=1981982 RepID=UPI000B989CAF|nr:mannose/fructose/sorbose PTS transporter subunit IIA [Aerococcus sp. 1KP-2016]OYQ67359.1 PTS mannose transporter subunit IIAB [Aerococcus sp. 1KP-2016]